MKIKILPNNFDQLDVNQLKELLVGFDGRKKTLTAIIEERIQKKIEDERIANEAAAAFLRDIQSIDKDTYEQQRFDQLIDDLKQNKNKKIKMVYSDDVIKYFTITDEFIRNARRYIYIDEDGEIGSDSAHKKDKFHSLIQWSIREYKPTKYTKKTVAFFPYKFKEGKEIPELLKYIEDTYKPCFLVSIQQSSIELKYKQMIESKFNDQNQYMQVSYIKDILRDIPYRFILQDYSEKDNHTTTTINPEQKNEIFLGMYMNHIFLDETFVYLKKYNIQLYNTEKKTVGSVLRYCMKNGYFEDKEYNEQDVLDMYNQDDVSIQNVDDTLIENLQQEIKIKKPKENQTYFIFADTETTTTIHTESKSTLGMNVNDRHDYQKTNSHKCYLLCALGQDDKKFTSFGSDSPREFLNWVMGVKKQLRNVDVIVYFHNLSYDISSFIQQNAIITEQLQVNGRLLRCKINNIEFRDSLRIVPMKLKDMPKIFGLKSKKEAFPYNFYTQENLVKNAQYISDALPHVNEKDRDQFVQNIRENKIFQASEGKFRMREYAQFYCEQDCSILKQSFMKFRQTLQDKMDMRLEDSLSISSLSIKFQQNKGALIGCFKQYGILQKFIQKCVVGGRCMSRYNKKYMVKQGDKDSDEQKGNRVHIFRKILQILDFDAVSLYPSAQNRTYYPAGKCMKMTREQIQHYNKYENLKNISEDKEGDQNTLFVKVRLFRPKTELGFAILSQKDDSFVRQFGNFDETIQFCGHVMLQDAINFQGYEYEIIEGLYFTERNYNIQTIVREMFQNRLNIKQEMKKFREESDEYIGLDVLQNVYKLMLNSSYGKLIENIHPTSCTIMNKGDQAEDYINRNYYQIKDIQEFQNYYVINSYQQIIIQGNYAHCGVMVLDMSKRIMNEVMTLADDKIFYQDTDSMHIQKDDVDKLVIDYELKYPGRKLIGENMGQFHSDFKSDLGKPLYSNQLIILGKKCYLDNLYISEGVTDYHIRMKGISNEVITNMGDVSKVYEDLFNGKSIKFDLCSGEQVIMEKNKIFEYNTKQSFVRELSFL